MIFSKKLVKVGHSQGFIIPSNIIKELRIGPTDFVEVRIKKIMRNN